MSVSAAVLFRRIQEWGLARLGQLVIQQRRYHRGDRARDIEARARGQARALAIHYLDDLA